MDGSFIASIPDEETRNWVGDYFMKNGKISGAEFYCVAQSPDQILVGVDDVSLYNSSYDLYSEVFAAYNRFSSQIKYIDAPLCRSAGQTSITAGARYY